MLLHFIIIYFKTIVFIFLSFLFKMLFIKCIADEECQRHQLLFKI